MYSTLFNALKATGIPFAEYAWSNAPTVGSYGVISLDGSGESLWASNSQQECAIEGTIDLFVRGINRDEVSTVQQVLDSTGVSWRLESMQYEHAKRIMHYEWVFQLEVI